MAKLDDNKKQQIREMARKQAEQDVIRQQQEEMLAMKQKTDEINQKGMNQAHEPEFSAYAEGTGNESLNNITDEKVQEAYNILVKYREKKQKYDEKIAENEEFWKINHWDVLESGKEDDERIKPKSAWLFNTIINKHADAMDNYPEPNILPRSRDDEEAAKILSQIIPVILEQNNYEQTYSDCAWYQQKHGTSVSGVFWNNDKQNGLGDIDIKKIDIMNLYWKPGITDIQDSPNVFYITMMDNDELSMRYPNIKPGTNLLPLNPAAQYRDGEDVTQAEQSAVIDWYYKKRVSSVDEDGIPFVKTYLHYCKFCNGQVIYASENDPNYVERGYYDHQKYPFVFDVLFPVERSIVGMGYIDIIKDDQLYIDKMQQAILENTIGGASPRYAVNDSGSLNEDEFNDPTKRLVHFSGSLGENDFRQIVQTPLSGIYETVLMNKISELKDVSGNTAASQGQTSSVTSASGIASLQEAAGKLPRDSNKASYRSFKQLIDLVIELIRQFYNEPRTFRITGDNGKNEYVTFSNESIQPQSQGSAFGYDLGSRLPILDIDVKPQKKSQYTVESQNQTALNLYAQGFFAPANADAALAVLDMMEFDGIEKVKENIGRNRTLLQLVQQYQAMLLQLAPIVDKTQGTNITEQIMQQANQTGIAPQPTGSIKEAGKGSLSSQAASATRNSTSPK